MCKGRWQRVKRNFLPRWCAAWTAKTPKEDTSLLVLRVLGRGRAASISCEPADTWLSAAALCIYSTTTSKQTSTRGNDCANQKPRSTIQTPEFVALWPVPPCRPKTLRGRDAQRLIARSPSRHATTSLILGLSNILTVFESGRPESSSPVV